MLGAFGGVLIFITSLVAGVIVGAFALAYAGHCLLVVVEATAAGNDEVDWPQEPFLDWVGKGVYLVLLTGIWLTPAWLVGHVATTRLDPAVRNAAAVGAGLAFLWLMLPVSLLSALSANSRWVVLRPALAGPLLRRFGSVVVFYFLAGLVSAGCAALAGAALLEGGAALLPVAAMAGAAGFLVYARLLGRLAWVVGQAGGPRRPPARPQRPKSPPRRPQRPPRRSVEVRDPWAVPPEVREKVKPPPIIIPLEGPVEPYELTREGPPAGPRHSPVLGFDRMDGGPRAPGELPEPERQWPRDKKTKPPPIVVPVEGPVEGYDVSEQMPSPAPPPPPIIGRDPIGGHPTARGAPPNPEPEEPAVPPPSWPMFGGVFTFPWYGASLMAWLRLSLYALALGVLFRTLLATWPGD